MVGALARAYGRPFRPVTGRPAAAIPASVWPILAVVLVTFALRASTFGNPILEPDEQFYLLVGDRLLHGQLPYVELWDRKPIGLFLFYAGVRALGGTGIVQYQIAATACAAITACLIQSIARRGAGAFGAFVAAVAYILFLNPLHGEGGQAPVIYNGLVAFAGWAAFRANDTADPRRILRLGIAAMAACGIAIQFKYTPAIEGIGFGCWFLWRLHAVGTTPRRWLAAALAMIGVALLPTIAVGLAYWRLGHLDALIQTNLVSIFQRSPFPPETRIRQRFIIAVVAAPLALLLPIALTYGARVRAARSDYILNVIWCLAAFTGFAMLRDVFDSYFMVVLPPLLILISRIIGTRPLGFVAATGLIAWPMLIASPSLARTQTDAAVIDRIAAAIRPHVGARCLYVYDGPAILYLLTDACAPTRYLYPDHLTNPTEIPALSIDAVAEEARILATRPGAIVTADRPLIPHRYAPTQALVARAIARDYVRVARIAADRVYSVWALRPAPAAAR